MFTGIIEAVGSIADIRMIGGDMRLYIRTGTLDLADVKLGDSIATNGVCLTAVELPGDGFIADVSRETLAHTRFESLQVGEAVNLEKAMRADTRFGGHIVTGHVDALGTVVERSDDARSVRLQVRMPASIQRYVATKGSITVDGVSLTVNALEGDSFLLNIVPHTAQETLIDSYTAGRQVHLEVDIIARYLERLMGAVHTDAPSDGDADGVTMALLANHGFMRR
ncbi:MAG: riboflavin synthase [Oceanospirillales bacterium]|uniref:Riboflavin synthase n=1 Tax=Marinobacterium halophilum TaxID=267374 RepID=A0A2P8EXF3_9GAMM|nr:riboflavin synthase [Marinobacterium halophilum]MBR9827206.1 riboflavin synthase [Oceanospirillales bacterium]PSL14151.1 riboflavin synthase alpha chain [Marinobacterium halophilum]